MDDFERVFEKEISRFNLAKCHIKINYAIYVQDVLWYGGKPLLGSMNPKTGFDKIKEEVKASSKNSNIVFFE